MAVVYTTKELADENGQGLGRYHWVSYSDEYPEEVRRYNRLTDLTYDSREEAEACPTAKALLDRVFGRIAEDGMSDDKIQTADAARSGMVGSTEALPPPKAEPNFPGYQQPAGATPGQRKGFTPEQLDLVTAVRAARRGFVHLLHAIGGTQGGQNDRMGSADLTIALRHVQDAEYRAIRHITGGPED